MSKTPLSHDDEIYVELRERCSVQNVGSSDGFVGLRLVDGSPKVVFPLGYSFPESYRVLQRDIRTLIGIILEAGKSLSEEVNLFSRVPGSSRESSLLRDFILLLDDYVSSRRMFSELESHYARKSGGVISWPRTIARVTPVFSRLGDPVFLNFIVKEKRDNHTVILRDVHEYCLYLSYRGLGWLYPDLCINPSKMHYSKAECLSAIRKKLSNTNVDREIILLKSMHSIIEENLSSLSVDNLEIGTYRFEYVWEYLVNKTFGIPNRGVYFPKAIWNLHGTGRKNSSSLEPDSIMILDDATYVLDAKYYKYGISFNPKDLPASSDVSKQVIYGQAVWDLIAKGHVRASVRVFNSFIIPANLSEKGEFCEYIGSAEVSWISAPREHERVAAVLVDTTSMLRGTADERSLRKLQLSKVVRSASCESGLS